MPFPNPPVQCLGSGMVGLLIAYLSELSIEEPSRHRSCGFAVLL